MKVLGSKHEPMVPNSSPKSSDRACLALDIDYRRNLRILRHPQSPFTQEPDRPDRPIHV